ELKGLPGLSDTESTKIIQGRPYTDKNQLVSRHVVSEATYDKIKDHVVAKQPKSKACHWGPRRHSRGPSLFCLLTRCEATLLEQCSDVRVAAAKCAIKLHRVFCVSGAVNVFQTVCELAIEDIASLGKGRIAVGLQHLRPEIRIIPGGIAAAGKQMLKVRRAMAQANLPRHANPVEKFAFELREVQCLR